jgi:hypothetical protein
MDHGKLCAKQEMRLNLSSYAVEGGIGILIGRDHDETT